MFQGNNIITESMQPDSSKPECHGNSEPEIINIKM